MQGPITISPLMSLLWSILVQVWNHRVENVRHEDTDTAYKMHKRDQTILDKTVGSQELKVLILFFFFFLVTCLPWSPAVNKDHWRPDLKRHPGWGLQLKRMTGGSDLSSCSVCRNGSKSGGSMEALNRCVVGHIWFMCDSLTVGLIFRCSSG